MFMNVIKCLWAQQPRAQQPWAQQQCSHEYSSHAAMSTTAMSTTAMSTTAMSTAAMSTWAHTPGTARSRSTRTHSNRTAVHSCIACKPSTHNQSVEGEWELVTIPASTFIQCCPRAAPFRKFGCGGAFQPATSHMTKDVGRVHVVRHLTTLEDENAPNQQA
jgi:ribosomal protein L37AE/L43A